MFAAGSTVSVMDVGGVLLVLAGIVLLAWLLGKWGDWR